MKEGVRGLYRGLQPTILALLPNWAVYFSVYNGIKTRLGGAKGTSSGNESMYVNFIAAGCAGCSTTFITNPLWVVKTRLQTQIAAPEASESFVEASRASSSAS